METPEIIRVGFDDQIFVAQKYGGISKYFVELIKRLPKFGIEPVICSSGTRNAHLAESRLVTELPPDKKFQSFVRGSLWRLGGWFSTSTLTKASNLDVLHHTFTTSAYLNKWNGPRVVTIFDMTPEVFPGYFKLGNPHFAKRKYCEVSDALISISASTTRDMAHFYGDSLLERVYEIPFGVGEAFFEESESKLKLPQNYILFVGVRKGYKRFDMAFKAFRELAEQDPTLSFVVVGGGPFTKAELAEVERAGLRERVFRIAPSDDEMPDVYRKAKVFLFPSEYEGFGLPTLESLATGTPTVLADASCSREVGGNVAIYFSPGEEDELLSAALKALSPEWTRYCRKAGPEHAREFAWDKVAEQTAELYRKVASGKR